MRSGFRGTVRTVHTESCFVEYSNVGDIKY